jgi:hypothetical protein
MSDYTKSTNFATKDNLSSGNALKIVKGSEIDTEFNNIATAISTKADLASPAFTGTPTGVTQSAGNNSTALATTAFVQAALSALYPVGSIYTNATSSTNPGTSLGFGTWTAFGAGRVMVGFNASNTLFDTAEETGGSADSIVVSHTHTATSTVTDPTHSHASSGSSTVIVGNAAVGNVPAGGSTVVPTGNNTLLAASTGISVATTNASTGVSGTDTNYQPYITVYMWKRTA